MENIYTGIVFVEEEVWDVGFSPSNPCTTDVSPSRPAYWLPTEKLPGFACSVSSLLPSGDFSTPKAKAFSPECKQSPAYIDEKEIHDTIKQLPNKGWQVGKRAKNGR